MIFIKAIAHFEDFSLTWKTFLLLKTCEMTFLLLMYYFEMFVVWSWQSLEDVFFTLSDWRERLRDNRGVWEACKLLFFQMILMLQFLLLESLLSFFKATLSFTDSLGVERVLCIEFRLQKLFLLVALHCIGVQSAYKLTRTKRAVSVWLHIRLVLLLS